MYEETDARAIISANNLSKSLVRAGLWAEARHLARKQFNLARALGDRHKVSIMTAVRLADALWRNPAASRADVLEADALFADAIKRSRIALGPHHPLTVAIVHHGEDVRHKLAGGDVIFKY